MANKILNNRENNNYYNHDSVYLLKHWVGKEAYLKYIGTGIVDDLNKIDLESIEKENNCVSILNNYFCMYAFSKNKINTNIEYYIKRELLSLDIKYEEFNSYTGWNINEFKKFLLNINNEINKIKQN